MHKIDWESGDRVLDLRAVARSGGMFTAAAAAPTVAGLSGLGWHWCVLAAVVAGFVGFLIARVVGRIVFPVPPGETAVTRVGPTALGTAVRASLAGGFIAYTAAPVIAFAITGAYAAAVAFAVGLVVSISAGCLAALS